MDIGSLLNATPDVVPMDLDAVVNPPSMSHHPMNTTIFRISSDADVAMTEQVASGNSISQSRV